MGVFNGAYRLRWEVLSRDKFTCQYCGQTAPNVKLEVDHIMPVSNGGQSTLANLITSCYACNLGKRDTLLVGTMTPPKRNRMPSLADHIAEYLFNHGPATATEIAKAIKRNRGNISTVLNNNPIFVRMGTKKRDVFYGVRQDL